MSILKNDTQLTLLLAGISLALSYFIMRKKFAVKGGWKWIFIVATILFLVLRFM